MERIAANSCKHQSTATQGKCRAYKAAVRTSDKILLRLKQPSFDCSASSTATNPTLERALKNYESSKEVGGEEGILRSRIALAIFRDGVDQSMRAGKCKAGQTITSATFAAVAKETNIEHAKVARLYKYGKALTQLARIESCLILILGKDTVLLWERPTGPTFVEDFVSDLKEHRPYIYHAAQQMKGLAVSIFIGAWLDFGWKIEDLQGSGSRLFEAVSQSSLTTLEAYLTSGKGGVAFDTRPAAPSRTQSHHSGNSIDNSQIAQSASGNRSAFWCRLDPTEMQSGELEDPAGGPAVQSALALDPQNGTAGDSAIDSVFWRGLNPLTMQSGTAGDSAIDSVFWRGLNPSTTQSGTLVDAAGQILWSGQNHGGQTTGWRALSAR